jgi:hypothetical protein
MSVRLLQTEKTYEVSYNGDYYTVTVMTDNGSFTYSYDVFDEEGEIVGGKLEQAIINYLEEVRE